MRLLTAIRRSDMRPLRQAAAILLAVVALECAAVLIAPLRYERILAVVIPASIPVLLAMVILPGILRSER